MISLEEYILENKRTTSSNKDRRNELEKWLKGKKYSEYVNCLNKMLDDPKAATLLKDGFGGELGDTKLTFSVKHLKPKALRPTQSEIDVDKSLKHALDIPSNIDNDFKKEVVIANMPLVTFRSNYIIDGHHRWSEAAIVNPDANMVCFDYDSDEISPIQMLKAVQGNIAAVYAERGTDDDIPSGKTKGQNLYDDKWNEKAVRSYIEDNLVDVCEKKLEKYLGVSSKEEVVNVLVENAMSVKTNQYPESGSPNRAEMPQTDKAGTKKGDKKSSYPDKDGSALHRMATQPFDKNAVK